MRIPFWILATALTLLRTGAFADAPKLVSTSPQFWATNVDPSTKTLSLKFDQPLRTRFFDWFGKDVLSPASSLKTVFSADELSCDVDVQLAPGKVFICGLNERGISGVGFQNKKGISLPPTFLVFQTAGTPVPDDAPPRAAATRPAANAQELDASRLKAVTITFDKPMQTQKHGLHMLENKKEVDLSKTPFQFLPDGKTFTLIYDFKPASRYDFTLNSTRNIGFASKQRVPLWPVTFSFSTN